MPGRRSRPQLEKLKEDAVKRGLITPAQAADARRPARHGADLLAGFSTQERVTTDAGRGAGMDIVRILVAELGGRVGVSTAVGRFAKFRSGCPRPPSPGPPDLERIHQQETGDGAALQSRPLTNRKLKLMICRRFEHHPSQDRARAADRAPAVRRLGRQRQAGGRSVSAPSRTSSRWTSRCRRWMASSASRTW